LNDIMVLGALFGFVSFISVLFTKHIGRRCSSYRCPSKVTGCPSNFWDLFLLFHSKAFLVISLFSPHHFFNSSSLSTWPSSKYLGDS
jgi:hypothetical protein